MVKVTRQSCLTGKHNTMKLDVTEEQLHAWRNGELIQRIMPELTVHEREFLITGMSIEEQNEFYDRLEE